MRARLGISGKLRRSGPDGQTVPTRRLALPLALAAFFQWIWDAAPVNDTLLPGQLRWGLQAGGRTSFPFIPCSVDPSMAVGDDVVFLATGTEPRVEVFHRSGEKVRHFGALPDCLPRRIPAGYVPPGRASAAPIRQLLSSGWTMSTLSPGTVTQLLARMRSGDPEALDRLFPLVYESLKDVARGQLRHQRGGHLATTELVHETYLKLVGSEPLGLRGRGHFFALAARAMRQVLVDDARRRLAARRVPPAPAPSAEQPAGRPPNPVELLAVDEGLDRLHELNPRLRRVVELKFFAGLKQGEIAELLDVTTRTVERDWAKARLFLHRELHPEAGERR